MSTSLRLIAGCVLGGLGLWLTLRGVPPAAIRDTLAATDPLLAAAALAATLIALAAVVARWQVLLAPGAPGYSLLFRATVVGQMINVLVPLRMGEVARVVALASNGRDPMHVGASLAIEKALDLILFGVSAAIVVSVAVIPAETLRPFRWIVLPAAGACALAVALVVARWNHERGAPEGTGLVGKLRRAVALSAIVLTKPALALRVMGWSALILGGAAAGNQLLLLACGIDTPWWTGLALLVVLQAGSVPPSLPGRLGVYNYLTVLTLGIVGVEAPVAAAYSLALYGIAYVPKLVLGAIFLTDPTLRPASLSLSNG